MKKKWMNLIFLCLGVQLLTTQVTIGEFIWVMEVGEVKPTGDVERKSILIHSPLPEKPLSFRDSIKA